jgi:hypothetical protein
VAPIHSRFRVGNFIGSAFHSTERSIFERIDEAAERWPALDLVMGIAAAAHLSWLVFGVMRDWIIAPPL